MSALHRQFFGDAECNFALSPELILELERKTGAGIGALYRRFRTTDFHYIDIPEIIRLGLIGGGEDPKRAQELVATYIGTRPLLKSAELAFAILDALWIGKTVDDAPVDDPILKVKAS